MSAPTKPILETRQLARRVIKSSQMKKHHPSILSSYKNYVTQHEQLDIPGNPVSQATFYRMFNEIPEGDRIRARVGKKAAREYERICTGSADRTGFMVSQQADGYHEPIKLLNSFDFTVRPKKPIHHFVIETTTSALLGMSCNYETGGERADYVIDSMRSAVMPKTRVQERWGTVNPWPCYGKTFQTTIDAGAAYNCQDHDNFHAMMHQNIKVTRTRRPYEKELIEVFNKIVKEDFTLTLDGSYDDKLDDAYIEKIVPVYTELEHEILFRRWLVDKYNQSVNKDAPGGMTRTEHFLFEAQRQPPVLPNDPLAVMNYLGVEDRKTIMDKKGIQIKVLDQVYKYNSPELQAIGRERRNKIKDPAMRRVFLKFSVKQPDFIMVKHPKTKKPIRVNRVQARRGDVEARRRLRHNIDPMFYDMQDHDLLAAMSTEEIHAHAKARRRAMDEAARARRRNAAATAIAIETSAAQTEQRLAETLKATPADSEDDSCSAEDESPAPTSSPSPASYEAEEVSWMDSL